MWTLVQPFLFRHAVNLLGWLAAAGAVAAVLFGARQAGRNAERVERMKTTIEVQHAQLEAATRRPHDRNDLARRLRDGSF